MITLSLALVGAYLIGSVPFGMILTRLFGGQDLRSVGSGNIGATNALRAGGKAIGITTLLLDALKGTVGALVALALIGDAAPAWAEPAALAAPVLGHVFPVWLLFRGGKGVATALGVLAVADWRLLVLGALVFLVFAVPTRYVSLGSVLAALAVGVGAFFWHGAAPIAWGILVVALLVIGRHHENIARLIKGEEHKIGAGKEGRSR